MASVVQSLVRAVQWVNHYPLYKYYQNLLSYPVVSDLSNG